MAAPSSEILNQPLSSCHSIVTFFCEWEKSHTDFIKFEDVGFGAELAQELFRGFAVWAPRLAKYGYT